MQSLKSTVLVIAAIGCAAAAPKPIDFDEVGRKLHEFGQKALPAVKGVCGFVNGYQGYPQGYPPAPAYPAYPQFGGYYPQQYPSYRPQFVPSYVPGSSNVPPSNGGTPGVATEQDDLNGIAALNGKRIPENVPPQIQDLFKNFDKLPQFDSNALDVEKLEQYRKQ